MSRVRISAVFQLRAPRAARRRIARDDVLLAMYTLTPSPWFPRRRGAAHSFRSGGKLHRDPDSV